MRWLLFLSRLAFICGFFFLLSVSILIKDWAKDQDLTATIITIGTFMGIIIVPVTLLCYLGVLVLGRKLSSVVPLWLVVSNILWMFLYLFYIVFLNGQGNHTS